ncbi:hypothetical protein ACSTIZ_00510, partial [Vibrio parahaemolyticus]
SLGRGPFEIVVLAAVSVASDVVKAVLPVVLARAVILRAWTHGIVAAVMLAVVIAFSLVSGTGFAALMRGASAAAHQNRMDTVSNRESEL